MADQAGTTNGTGGGEAASLMAQFSALQASMGGPDAEPAEEVGDEGETATGAEKPALPSKGEAKSDAAKTDPEKPEPAPTGRKAAELAGALREEKRRFAEKAARTEAAHAAREVALAAREAALDAVTPAKLKAMADSGDADALAKQIGFENWEACNTHFARLFADPSYREIKKLREENAARAQREKDREAAEVAAEQARQKADAEREYFQFVSTELAASEDPIIKGLVAEDAQAFAIATFDEIDKHYRRTREELLVEDAAARVVERAKSQYAKWLKVFGAPAAVEAPDATARAEATPDRAGSRKPPERTKHVTRKGAAEAAPDRELSHAEFIKMGARALEKSVADDIEKGLLG